MDTPAKIVLIAVLPAHEPATAAETLLVLPLAMSPFATTDDPQKSNAEKECMP